LPNPNLDGKGISDALGCRGPLVRKKTTIVLENTSSAKKQTTGKGRFEDKEKTTRGLAGHKKKEGYHPKGKNETLKGRRSVTVLTPPASGQQKEKGEGLYLEVVGRRGGKEKIFNNDEKMCRRGGETTEWEV